MRLLVFHLLVSKPQGRLQVIVRLLLGTFRAPNLHVKLSNTQFEKKGLVVSANENGVIG